MPIEVEPRPGTVGSLDRRVERLEAQVSELSTDVQLMKQEQRNVRDLMEQHFKTIERSIELASSKTDLLTSRFDAAVLQSASMLGDPSSTPAGKQIVERIATIEVSKEKEHAELDDRLTSVERRVYMAIGAGFLLLTALQVFGPLLARLVP